MLRIRFGLQGLALAAIYVFHFGPALAQAPPSSLQIFMPNGGLPPTAIRMTLTRDDGFTDIVFTDSKGKFDIRTPRGQTNNYKVTIESDKLTYDTTTVSFSLDSSPNQITVFLKPLSAEKRPADAVLDIATYEGDVPGKARAAYKQATESIKNGRFETAITNLQQAISIYPKYLRALNELGVVFLKTNRLDEAGATFRRAIDINQRFFHPRMNLGIVLTRQAKYVEALEILEPLYGENHAMLDVRLAYATALEGAREFADAEKLYRASLGSQTLSLKARADIQLRLGVVLNREGRFADAVAELDQAIELDPTAPNAHLQLGAALLQVDQLEPAKRELLRAYELGGNAFGGAQLLLGEIYYKQRKFVEAQRAFEQYLRDMPAAPNASQISQLIASLKAAPKQ